MLLSERFRLFILAFICLKLTRVHAFLIAFVSWFFFLFFFLFLRLRLLIWNYFALPSCHNKLALPKFWRSFLFNVVAYFIVQFCFCLLNLTELFLNEWCFSVANACRWILWFWRFWFTVNIDGFNLKPTPFCAFV